MRQNIDRTLQAFADASIKLDEALVLGRDRAFRAAWKTRMRQWNRLSRLGDRGKEALSTLLAHENSSVRVSAAMFLVDFDPKRRLLALETLRDASSVRDIGGLLAKSAIEQWEATVRALGRPRADERPGSRKPR